MKMHGVCISIDALEALTGEPPHLLMLYIWMCRYMDFHTGLVGKKRRISEQFIKERLEVDAIPGRKGMKPSRQMVRSSIDRLLKLGLIEPLGEYVFSLPYEQLHFSDQNSCNRVTTGLQPGYNPEKFINNSNLEESRGIVELSGRGSYNPPLINQSIKQTGAREFVMHEEWEPGEHFSARAGMMGFQIDGKDQALLNHALLDVRLYWMSNRPEVARNQTHWERSLLQTMKRIQGQWLADAKKDGNVKQGFAKSPVSGCRSASMLPALPRNDDELEAWAKQFGAPMPAAGDTYPQYRRELLRWRDRKVADEKLREKQG